MTKMPKSALVLGASGLLPFIFGALLILGRQDGFYLFDLFTSGAITQDANGTTSRTLQNGQVLLVKYSTVILCFMSGVLWGFATRAETNRFSFYLLSVLPALYTFFMLSDNVSYSILGLAAGFALLLPLDYWFLRNNLAPQWWMRLRIPLTCVVIGCLLIGWAA